MRYLYRFVYKLIQFIELKNTMLRVSNDFIYVDYYGRTWKLKPTGNYDYPFQVELMEQ
jgi:hypothetical protein